MRSIVIINTDGTEQIIDFDKIEFIGFKHDNPVVTPVQEEAPATEEPVSVAEPEVVQEIVAEPVVEAPVEPEEIVVPEVVDCVVEPIQEPVEEEVKSVIDSIVESVMEVHDEPEEVKVADIDEAISVVSEGKTAVIETEEAVVHITASEEKDEGNTYVAEPVVETPVAEPVHEEPKKEAPSTEFIQV